MHSRGSASPVSHCRQRVSFTSLPWNKSCTQVRTGRLRAAAALVAAWLSSCREGERAFMAAPVAAFVGLRALVGLAPRLEALLELREQSRETRRAADLPSFSNASEMSFSSQFRNSWASCSTTWHSSTVVQHGRSYIMRGSNSKSTNRRRVGTLNSLGQSSTGASGGPAQCRLAVVCCHTPAGSCITACSSKHVRAHRPDACRS